MSTLLSIPTLEGGILGKKVVLEIRCDRCKRVEYKTHKPSTKENKEDSGPLFSGEFMGESAEYVDLCSGCISIISMRWHEIVKTLKKCSPIRADKRDVAIRKKP